MSLVVMGFIHLAASIGVYATGKQERHHEWISEMKNVF